MGKTLLTARGKDILFSAKRDPFITDSYYLTGGTALSYYYLHHRISEDLDFFSLEEPNRSILETWSTEVAGNVKAAQVEFQTLRGQLVYFFHFEREVIKVDFAQYPFEHIGDFHKDGNLRVASMRDIAANKLQAIQTRARGRDYVDLYEIVHECGMKMNDLFNDYRLKFDLHVAPEEWAKYFAKVLDAGDLPRFLGNRNWAAVERYFLEEAKRLSSAVLTT